MSLARCFFTTRTQAPSLSPLRLAARVFSCVTSRPVCMRERERVIGCVSRTTAYCRPIGRTHRSKGRRMRTELRAAVACALVAKVVGWGGGATPTPAWVGDPSRSAGCLSLVVKAHQSRLLECSLSRNKFCGAMPASVLQRIIVGCSFAHCTCSII